MIGKRRRGTVPTVPPPEEFTPYNQAEHKGESGEVQAPPDDITELDIVTAAEPDRRANDWVIQALVGALRVLTGDRFVREFRLFSPEHHEIERGRSQLQVAILRRKRNLRKRVSS